MKIIESITFPVFVEDGEKYKAVIRDIRLFRALEKRAASIMLMAEMAGARIELTEEDIKIKPQKDAVHDGLALLFGSAGKLKYYGIRAYLLKQMPEGWYRHIADTLMRCAEAAIKAKDPSMPKADRRFLALNGRRDAPRFSFGGMTIHPEDGIYARAIKGGIALRWDKDMGDISFIAHGRDPRRSYVLHKLLEGGYELGAVMLNEDGGRLKATVSYSYEQADKAPDKSRVMEAEFCGGMNLLDIVLIAGHRSVIDLMRHETIDASPAVAGVDILAAQEHRRQQQAAFCGRRSPRSASEGNGPAARWFADKREKLSERRQNMAKTWNHTWTARLIRIAERMNAGTMVIRGEYSGIQGRTWPWSQFKEFLAYKCERAGIALTWSARPKAESPAV
jgi:hypothetical protein